MIKYNKISLFVQNSWRHIIRRRRICWFGSNSFRLTCNNVKTTCSNVSRKRTKSMHITNMVRTLLVFSDTRQATNNSTVLCIYYDWYLFRSRALETKIAAKHNWNNNEDLLYIYVYTYARKENFSKWICELCISTRFIYKYITTFEIYIALIASFFCTKLALNVYVHALTFLYYIYFV